MSRMTGSGTTREAILDAAEHLLGSLPYSQVSMARVAGEAGVSRQSVYIHFGTRGQLLLELVNRASDRGRLADIVGEAITIEDPVDRLVFLVDGVLRFNADIARPGLALREASAHDEDAMLARREGAKTRHDMLVTMLAAVEEHGRLRHGMDVETAVDLVSLLLTLTTFEDFVLHRGWTPEEYVTRTGAMIRTAVIEP